jgi:hypothetical protein
MLPRIGDVVAAARGHTSMVRPAEEPKETALIGHHGSLTEDEQLVPLLIAHPGELAMGRELQVELRTAEAG